MITENKDSINGDNDLIKQYIELVPHHIKTDEEMGIEANILLDKAAYAQHSELSNFAKTRLLIKNQLVSIKNLLEESILGKRSFKPALVLSGLIIIFCIVYYISFNEGKVQLAENQIKDAPISLETKTIPADTNPLIEEIDRMSLNVSFHSLNNDGSTSKFSKDIIYTKAYKAITIILKNHKIAIASSEQNSIITEWIRTENIMVRLIFKKQNADEPFYIFLKESFVQPEKKADSIKVFDHLDYKELITQIKKYYYNSFE